MSEHDSQMEQIREQEAYDRFIEQQREEEYYQKLLEGEGKPNAENRT